MFDKEQFPYLHKWVWWTALCQSKVSGKRTEVNPIHLNKNRSNALLLQSLPEQEIKSIKLRKGHLVSWLGSKAKSSLWETNRPLWTLQVQVFCSHSVFSGVARDSWGAPGAKWHGMLVLLIPDFSVPQGPRVECFLISQSLLWWQQSGKTCLWTKDLLINLLVCRLEGGLCRDLCSWPKCFY